MCDKCKDGAGKKCCGFWGKLFGCKGKCKVDAPKQEEAKPAEMPAEAKPETPAENM